MYGKVVNGEIVYAPYNYRLSNGTLIIGFNTNVELMIQYGYKEIVEYKVDYDPNTEELYISNIEETINLINVYYSSRDKSASGSGGGCSCDCYDKATIDAFINNLQVNKANISDLYAINAMIDNLQVNKADIEYLNATNAKIDNLEADKANITDLYATNAKIDNLEAYKADISILEANYATIEQLDATNANITNLQADTAHINNALIDKANIIDLNATNAKITDLQATKANITDLNAANANINTLTSDLADINTLINGNLTSDNIQSMIITGDKFTVADAFIKDAMIANVNASKINTGIINTNNVRIQSDDGSMIINGTTQQFKDKDNKVRIQIGKDAQGNFTFALFSQDGVGVLIDETGIKSGAVPDGLIVNDMVSEGANISGSKLDINSVISSINNGTEVIKGTRIELDEQGQSLQVAFNQLKTKVDTIEQVSIDGDLSSVMEQITSNTTSITTMQGQIKSLISNTTITKANGEVVQLKDEYNATVDTVNSHKQTIGLLETNLNKVSTGQNKWLLEMFEKSEGVDEISPITIKEIMGSALIKALLVADSDTNNQASYGDNYLGRATTYVYLDHDYDWETTATSDDGSTIYLNGNVVATLTSCDPNVVILPFKQGWNKITWVYNEGIGGDGWDFNPKLTTLSEIKYMNAYPMTNTDEVGNILDSNIKTVSSKQASLEQSLDGFKQTVSDTYATKAEFNNLQVGGTNLLLKSGNFKNDTGLWVSNGEDSSVTLDSSVICSGNSTIKIVGNGGARYDAFIQLKPNTIYTYSVLAKASSNINGNHTEPLHMWVNAAQDSTHLENVITHNTSIGTKWTKAWITFRTPDDGDVYYMKPFIYNIGDAIVWFANAKVEEGNKATDWSPAPEDINASIAAIDDKFVNYSTTSQMNSAITQKANEITSSVSETYATKASLNTLDGRFADYSTTSAMNSAIDQKANEITSSVSSVYITKSDFNGLAIGGTNLYFNSNFKTKPNYSEQSEGSIFNWDSSVDAGDVTTKYNGKLIQLSDSQGTSSSPKDVYLTLAQTVILEPNTTYTLSFDYYTTGAFSGSSSYIYLWKTKDDLSTRNVIPLEITNNDKNRTKLVKTFTTDSEHLIFQVRIGFVDTGNCWLAVDGVKLEKGNKATDWSPAPEDIDSSIAAVDGKFANYLTISAMDSSIEQKANEIISSVSEAYVTRSDFNSLNIGGRNFVINSGFEGVVPNTQTIPHWGYWGNVIVFGGQGNPNYDAINTLYLQNHTTTGGGICQDIPSTKIPKNTEITVSYDLSTEYNVISSYTTLEFLDAEYNKLDTILLSNAVGRVVRTVTTSNTDYSIMRFAITHGGSNSDDGGYLVRIGNIKLEKGNKATDWSPAPEDIDDSIATVDNKFANYSTTQQMNSVIDQKANEITSSVSEIYATKAEFNNLEIGGTNLLLNSSFANSTNDWLINVVSWSDITIIDENNSPTRKAIKIIVKNTGGGSGIYQRVTPRKAGNYTISFYAKADTDNYNILVGQEGSGTKDFSLTTNWTKYTYTYNRDQLDTSAIIFYTTANALVGTFYLHSIKLEYGDKATSWSPDPRDIDNSIATVDNKFINYSTISEMNSAIDQKANEITSTVSETYATKTSVVDMSNNLTNNYSTTQQMNSAIDQKANEITSSVSETYSTKVEFNDLSIGATNFIRNGRFKNCVPGSVNSVPGWNTTDGVKVWYGMGQGIYDKYGCLYFFKEVQDGNPCYLSQDILLDTIGRNVEVTLSYDASKEANDTQMYMEYLDASSKVLEQITLAYNPVGYNIHTFTTNIDAKYLRIVFKCGSVKGSDGSYLATLGNVKLEKGNRATDWSPAPEDIDDSIATIDGKFADYSTTVQMNSAIDQKANEITSTVSETYVTKQEIGSITDKIEDYMINISKGTILLTRDLDDNITN